MKKLSLLLAVFIVVLEFPAQSQDDVNLFDYWKYYTDASNSMYKTSCGIAFKQLGERKEAIAKLEGKYDFLKRQQIVKEKLLRLLGPLPERAPLNARITGSVNKKDYRVEKLVYESVPGYYVTAGLFLPNKIRGKAPAVIYASGHTENGFRSETYQHVIINLVKKGFVVLAFDPVGQGERLQYYNEDQGKSRFGSTKEHSFPGAQCYIAGYSPTKYFVWDGMRAVDYLLTRKEVDPERIGMTGRSGGGTQTAFTTAVDDRILAAAPECFITSMEYVLKTIGPQDAEQNVFHMISEGIDHADLLEIRAPKPGLMITTTRDFFSIQGARETYSEVRQFYGALGSEANFSMVEDDDVHASTKNNREAMYAFFQKYLDNPGSPEDLDVEVLDEQELWATATGQLVTSLEGETLFTLNKMCVEKQVEDRQSSRKISKTHLKEVLVSAKELSGYRYPRQLGNSLFSGRYVEEGYVLEKYLVPGSGDYMLPAVLFMPTTDPKEDIVLFLDDRGMENAAKEEDEVLHSMLQNGYSVLLFDVPGIGSLGPGYLVGDAYFDRTSFNQWFAGILTNKSIVGMRVEDIIRMVHFVKSEIGKFKGISALSIGALGSELLHAAAFDASIQNVVLLNSFVSYADIARSLDYEPSFIPSVVAGAIEFYDLADLMASLSPRKLMVVNPLAGSGATLDIGEATLELAYPMQEYSSKSEKDRISLIIEEDDASITHKIIRWLE